MITVDILTLTLIVGTIVPLVVALLTKSNASPAVKAVVNAVLAGVAGAGTALIEAHGGLRWQSVLIAAFSTYVVSGSSHAHLWKPTGVTATIAEATSRLGVGPADGGHVAR